MSEVGEARTSPILIAFLILAAIAGAFVVYEALRPSSSFYCWFHQCVCRHGRCGPEDRGDERTAPPQSPEEGNTSQAATPVLPADEHRFHALRRAAWQNDDFWAQIELGHLYNATRDNNDYDPVEAYVWYFLASINPQARYDGEVEYDGDYRYSSVFDARREAKRNRSHIAELFTSEERDDARDRIIYVLACRGPAGFVLLGELYSRWSPVGRDASDDAGSDQRGGPRSPDEGAEGEPVKPIAADDHDAMLYYQLAANSGSRLSGRYQDYVSDYQAFLKQDLGDAIGQEIAQSASIDAQRWHLPFAYYPGSHSRSGTPLTDECNGGTDEYPESADDTPISDWNVQQALWALNYLRDAPTKRILDGNSKEMFDAILAYQKDRGKEATGRLTIHQGLDVVTEAAEHQDPASEIALGKTYVLGSVQSVPEVANGDGEVWWQQVAKDKRASNYYRGMAFYDLATIYRYGYGNVPPNRTLAQLYMKYSQDMKFDPRLGPRALLCDPDELARDREPANGDTQ